jgi:hypothetical protein
MNIDFSYKVDIYVPKNRCSAAGIETGYELDDRGVVIRVSVV